MHFIQKKKRKKFTNTFSYQFHESFLTKTNEKYWIFEIVHTKRHQLQLNHQNKSNRLQHTISKSYQKSYQSIQIVNSLKFPQLQIFSKIWFGVCVEINSFFYLLLSGGRVRMWHVKMQYHEQEMDMPHYRIKHKT